MGRQSDAIESHDANTPSPAPATGGGNPAMVLPPPAPQNEQEGLQAGGQFQVSQDPVTRIHGDATRHPTNKQWTRSPTPRNNL